MPPEPIDRLRRAPLELLGRIVESSNATFLVSVGELDDDEHESVDGDDGPLADLGAQVRVGAPAEEGWEPIDEWDDEDEWDDGGEDGWDDDPDEDERDDGEEDGGDVEPAPGGAGPDRDEDDDDSPGPDGADRGPSTLPEGLKAVYKPLRGERPLWDFPEGLFRREVAAFELSRALGWKVIPATVVRDDVLGVGSLQRFVEADFSRHYFALRDAGRYDDQLRKMCLFDLLANNTDRKGGHVLVDCDDHLWGIDNGLCFSTEARLRTVIWDFAGDPVPDDLMDGVATLLECGLPDAVTDLLFDDEVDQILRRAKVIRSARRFPHDPTGRAIPWPLI